MLDFLDSLRRKPLHIRRQVAIVTTAVLSSLIMTVWVQSWDVRNVTNIDSAPKSKTPTQILLDGAKGLKSKGAALIGSSMEEIKFAADSATLASTSMSSSTAFANGTAEVSALTESNNRAATTSPNIVQ